MKRSPMPPRKAYMKRGTKPLPRINLRKARRQADKYQSYLRSPEWKEKKRLVRERSGGVCEERFEARVGNRVIDTWRCSGVARVCNHKTYARFGNELLTDLEDLCIDCNSRYENARPWRASRRLALARGEKA